MNYEQILKANESIKTTDIKGRDYAEVNQRIKAFRMVEPNGTITTDIVSLSNGVCVIKATIYDGNNHELATGHAYEKEDSSFINKTSYIENCETSAVGRALGMCGFGIDTSIASYEETANAIANQKPKKQDVPFEEVKEEMTLDAARQVGIVGNDGKVHKVKDMTKEELEYFTTYKKRPDLMKACQIELDARNENNN